MWDRSFHFISILLLIIACYSAACGLRNPRRAQELNKIGLKYSAQGSRADALKYFIEAYEMEGITDSQRTIYMENIGNEYWMNNVDSAIYYYAQAARVNNRNSFNWLYCMANVYILKGQTDTALLYGLRANDRNSKDMLANNLVGLIYMGEFGQDYYAPEKALKYNLRSYEAYYDVASEFALAKNYYLLNKMDKAIPLFEDVCKKSPDRTAYTGSLAMIYQELGRESDANRLLAEIKIKEPLRYEKIVNMQIKAGQHGITWHP
jgi:tetratricopeptide (TPR) repeat protein